MLRSIGRSLRVAIWGLASLAGCSSAPPAPPRVATPPSRPATGATPTKVTPFIPPEISGFHRKEAPATYGPETLYEYINGAADGFLAFDFEELTAVAYVHPSKAEVSVEVYRHRTAERAYGAYAMERPAGSLALPVGIEGYGGRDYLQFVLGPYYVKLALVDSKDFALLRAVADGVAGVLPGPRDPPPVLKCFPLAGRLVRAEKFAARDFLGRGFLHDAVAVPYELAGSKFRLFAVRGRDATDAREMVTRYLRVSGDRGSTSGVTGSTTVNDPVNGSVLLHWKDRWVWGAVDNPPPSSAPLLEQLGTRLAREQP
jgi:hypothetical protein